MRPSSPVRDAAIVGLVLANALVLYLLASSGRTSNANAYFALIIEVMLAVLPRLAVHILSVCLCVELVCFAILPASRAAPAQRITAVNVMPAFPVRAVPAVPSAVGEPRPDGITVDGAAPAPGVEMEVGASGRLAGSLRNLPPDGKIPSGLMIGAYLLAGQEYAGQLVGSATPSEAGAWIMSGVGFRVAATLTEAYPTLVVVAAYMLPEVLDHAELMALPARVAVPLKIRRPRLTLTTVCDRLVASSAPLPMCRPFSLGGRAENVFSDDREKVCVVIHGQRADGEPFLSVMSGVFAGDRWSALPSDPAELWNVQSYSLRFALVPFDQDSQSCGDGTPTEPLRVAGARRETIRPRSN